MQILPKRTKDPAAALEADLVSARKSLDRLAGQLADAEAAHLAARNRRLRVLIDGDVIDAKELTKIDSDVRIADDRLEAIAGAKMMVGDKIAALEKEIAAARDSAERERAAAALEHDAAEIEAVARDLDEKARELSAMAERMGDTLQRHGAGETAGLYRILRATGRLALPSVVVANGFEVMGTEPDRIGAHTAAKALQSDPLRAHAAAIRAGTIGVGDLQRPAALMTRITIETTTLVLAESIEWTGETGATVQVNEGGCQVPVLVADKCIELGIGFPADSPRGVEIMRALQRGEPSRYGQKREAADQGVVRRGPPWRNIGVNLFAWIEAERARLVDERRAAE